MYSYAWFSSRNHNLIAGKLKSRHSHWTDERLFQEARKINVALVQHVTYTEFLDALLGTPNDVCVAKDTLHENFYDRAMDGTIDMGFSTAGYRLHTLISDSLECRNKDYKLTDKLQLREVFHNPLSLLANETYDDITRGMCMQPLREFNNVFSHEMTEWLFMEKEKNFGMDIVALNVQRGRDHMIPGYPAYREHCGLGKADTWREMGDLIPSDIVHRLLHTYRKPDDVDLYIGGNMEAPVVGSMLGPTNHCLVR